jgi:MFS family permease
MTPPSQTAAPASVAATDAERGIWKVIGASAAGTVIEWYDFYIFGTLATIIAAEFYPDGNAVVNLLKTLATFAVGFAVRPFGAVFFGRIGDLVGRKYAFLLTLLIMGGATAAIGILPGYATIGIAAPILLVLMRTLQGLALGGEYGGAATYVAEHSPDHKRGFYTSFIQITATAGLFLALGVVTATRLILGEEAFVAWGWRIPFLLSVVLVFLSYWIRRSLKESPIFTRLKAAGKTSTQPIRDSFGNRRNWKVILLVLFGATAGQAVVWYTGQFYALYFLQTTLSVPLVTSSMVVAIALLLASPFFVVFGALSDRIGRKKVMMAGNLIAAISYYPIYRAMTYFAGAPDASGFATDANLFALTALVFIQVIFVTMVYGPIAAFLVEAFPAKIRYTSMSLPYHFGNGWFGGWLPFIAVALTTATGNIYAGLFYPIGIALLTFAVGMVFLRETRHRRIWDEVDEPDGAGS